MTQNPLCYGIYGNVWKIANYLIGDNYPELARDVRTSNGMLSSVKRLLVTIVVFSNFFSRVIFLMSPQIVCLKWCIVAKIAFPKFFSWVISSVYTNALLQTMLNQHGFMQTWRNALQYSYILKCCHFQTRIQFDRPKWVIKWVIYNSKLEQFGHPD